MVNNSYFDMLNNQYGLGGTTPMTSAGTSSLFGDMFNGENFGSTLGGIAGLGQLGMGLYFGNQMMDENKRNNSLYRQIAREQQNQHNASVKSWA